MDGAGIDDADEYARLAESPHKDRGVVACDVQRSLWSFVSPGDAHALALHRAALARLLHAAVGGGLHEGRGREIHYYQGLHDVASVLLMVVGEAKAHAMLGHLVRHALRDCTRADLQPVLSSLALVPRLLSACDPGGLGTFARESGVAESPHFALTWRLTWFAHDLKTLTSCARLFDVFLASHPLMPLYMGVAALTFARDRILADVPCDFASAHQALARVSLTEKRPLPEVIARALHLYRTHPPAALAMAAPSSPSSPWRVGRVGVAARLLMPMGLARPMGGIRSMVGMESMGGMGDLGGKGGMGRACTALGARLERGVWRVRPEIYLPAPNRRRAPIALRGRAGSSGAGGRGQGAGGLAPWAAFAAMLGLAGGVGASVAALATVAAWMVSQGADPATVAGGQGLVDAILAGMADVPLM